MDKGILLKIEDNSSHLGTVDVAEENYNQAEIYAMIDFIIEDVSYDCKY